MQGPSRALIKTQFVGFHLDRSCFVREWNQVSWWARDSPHSPNVGFTRIYHNNPVASLLGWRNFDVFDRHRNQSFVRHESDIDEGFVEFAGILDRDNFAPLRVVIASVVSICQTTWSIAYRDDQPGLFFVRVVENPMVMFHFEVKSASQEEKIELKQVPS